MSYKLMPEEALELFAVDAGLHRRRADGSWKLINSIHNGRLVAIVNNERIPAIDIAWCLHWGNWPLYPLVQVDGNPYNLSMDNIFPVRRKELRFRADLRGGLFFHPLSDLAKRSKPECRQDWARLAADEYRKELPLVLREEEEARALRNSAPDYIAREVERQAAVRKEQLRKRLAAREGTGAAKPPPKRPKAVPGRVWHWYKKNWVSVPEPVHVSDDYRLRLQATLDGATDFTYSPEYDQVLIRMPDGSPWVPSERP